MAVLAAAIAVEYVFDAEFYRRLAETRLQEMTGLPAHLASLDIDLLPTPNVDGRGLTLGEGDFRFEVDVFTAGFDVRELLSGGRATGQVRVAQLRVQLPEDPADVTSRVTDLLDALQKRASGEGLPLDLHRVSCDDLQVFQGERLRVHGEGEVRDALGPRPTIGYAVTLPTARGPVAATGTGTLRPSAADGPFLECDGTVSADAFQLSERLGAVGATLSMHAQVTHWDDIYAVFDGPVTHPALSDGSLEGKAWRRDGEYIANDVVLRGAGVEIKGDLTYTPGQPVAVHLPEGRLSGPPLDTLLSAAAAGKVDAGAEASLAVTDLTFGAGEGAPPRFVSGAATVAGLRLVPGEGWPALAEVGGSFTVAENVVRLSEFGNDRVRVSGTLTPDFGSGQSIVALTGDLQLDQGLLPEDSLPEAVSGLAARIHLERVGGTFTPHGETPVDLEVAGRIDDGHLTVASGRVQDEIDRIAGTFSGDRSGLAVQLSATSAALGKVGVEGALSTEAKTFTGHVDADLARAVRLVQREGTLNPYLKSLFTGYGQSTFEVQAARTDDALTLRLARAGAPRLDVDITARDSVLETVQGAGDVDLAWFAPALPPRVHVTGTAPIAVTLGGDQRFTMDANLNQASIAAGKYLEKKAGDHAQLRVDGRTVEGRWTPEQVTAACLGETVTLDMRPGGFVARDLNLRLPALVQLLPPGATATGTLSGTITSGPFAADLELSGAGFGVSPDVRLDHLDGRVVYRDEVLLVDGLHVLGADSDCTVSAGLEDGRWTGRIRGDKLNLNAMDVMYDSARALYEAKGRPQAPDAVARHRLTGVVDVDIRSLYYRRGRVDDVTCRWTLEEDRMHFDDLACRVGEGRVTGKAWVRYKTPDAPATVAAQLEARGIDLKAVDDFALREPRGMRGTADANLAVRFATGSGRPWQHGADGALVFSAENGTYGQLAHGGALLAVLKTTNLFRLKLPQYREQGLSFQSTSGRIDMEAGVATLNDFVLDAGSHAMDGEARVDYPADTLEGEMRFYILESVTGLLDRVPGLGGAVGALKERSGLRIAIRGTPEKPAFGKPEETRFETRPIVRGSQGALREGATAVEDGLRTGARSIRRTIEAIGF